MSQRPVVFLHVMKCGGTSVRAGLAEGLAGQRHGPGVFELDGDAAKYAAAGNDQDNWRFRDALLPYVLTALEPAIVLGHFRYRDRYKDLLDRSHFVTVMREPVDRLVSLYRYRRYKETVDVPVSMLSGSTSSHRAGRRRATPTSQRSAVTTGSIRVPTKPSHLPSRTSDGSPPSGSSTSWSDSRTGSTN